MVLLTLSLKVSGRRERARTVSMSNADICHLRLWELVPVSVLHWYKRVPWAGTRATWQPGFKTQLPWAHRVWFHQPLSGPFWPHHAHFLGLNSLLAQWLWGKGSLTSTFQQLWATPATLALKQPEQKPSAPKGQFSLSSQELDLLPLQVSSLKPILSFPSTPDEPRAQRGRQGSPMSLQAEKGIPGGW